MEEFSPKYIGDLIGVSEACELLNISRTTLVQYRKKYEIPSIKVRRALKFSKVEVLQKLFTVLNPPPGKVAFTIYSDSNIESLKIDDSSYDLRMIDMIDGHGAISLICHLISEMNKGKNIHLLFDSTNIFLKSMGFFSALRMYLNKKIFWDDKLYESIESINYEFIKLPIRKLGVVGAHTKLADALTVSLSEQGYSGDICSYIGWAMGELADNSATHAKTHPSFTYFEEFAEDRRFLQLTIGDTGIGIAESLRSNVRYKNLDNNRALIMAFKPYVSGRADEEKRGKGLTDVLQIAMECGSNLRVESSGVGYIYAFNEGVDNFRTCSPIYKDTGTIISILFIDGQFGSVERADVDNYIDNCLEKL
jgi:excisionase family DNA binding protein